MRLKTFSGEVGSLCFQVELGLNELAQKPRAALVLNGREGGGQGR